MQDNEMATGMLPCGIVSGGGWGGGGKEMD